MSAGGIRSHSDPLLMEKSVYTADLPTVAEGIDFVIASSGVSVFMTVIAFGVLDSDLTGEFQRLLEETSVGC